MHDFEAEIGILLNENNIVSCVVQIYVLLCLIKVLQDFELSSVLCQQIEK